MNNGDRIRSMIDEQLAYFLVAITEPDDDTIVIDGKEFFSEDEVLKWLKNNC